MPREMKIEHSNVIKSLSDQELEAMIEYLKTSLEAQAGGSSAVSYTHLTLPTKRIV